MSLRKVGLAMFFSCSAAGLLIPNSGNNPNFKKLLTCSQDGTIMLKEKVISKDLPHRVYFEARDTLKNIRI